MKIKSSFLLQSIADEYLVVPIAEEADKIQGVIRLNGTGAFLWNCLVNGVSSINELVDSLVHEYRVDLSTAHDDVDAFIQQLEAIGCLEV